jgi:hypothetical protein
MFRLNKKPGRKRCSHQSFQHQQIPAINSLVFTGSYYIPPGLILKDASILRAQCIGIFRMMPKINSNLPKLN